MEYAIINQDNDIFALHRDDSEIATDVAKIKKSYPTEDIFVTFLREDDGQVVYLNQDMNHSIVGHAW